MVISEIIDRAREVVAETDEEYWSYLFSWKHDIEKRKCNCPNCQKEVLKVDNLIAQEGQLISRRRITS